MSDALAIRAGETAAVPKVSRETLPPAEVRQQLHRILTSRTFARSPRISRFLSFVVEQTLDGQEDKLKEYLLGVEVFNRTDSFDPRIDSIVRVEARRLRYKLDRYYETEGIADGTFIQFRKGCYVPLFSNKRAGDPQQADIFAFPHLNIIENPHSFALYAKARSHMGRWTPDGIAESISCFTQAVAEDPGCAEAKSGLAAAWTLAGLLGILPARDVMPKAKASSMDAILARPECAEGHAIQGIATAIFDYDWNDAEPKLCRAISMRQCGPELRLWYGLWALLSGRNEDAIRELRKAQQSEPTSVTAHLAAGFAYQLAKASDEAMMQYRLAQEIEPGCYAPHLAMGLLFTEQRVFEQAHHALSHASQMSPRNPNIMAVLVYSHASAGRTDAARQVLGEMKDIAGRQYVPPFTLALAHSALGETEQAVERLEQAYEERSSWLALVRMLPCFAAVRNDARYPALLARIGLT